MPLVGSRKILPVFSRWRNRDRRAVKVWRRRLPVRGLMAVRMSVAVT
jgi:hypothetical protein